MRQPMGYAVTVLAALCWGASGVSAEYLMSRHGIELTLISFLRMSIGGVLTLAYVLLRSRGVSARHRDLIRAPRNWRSLTIYAVFGLAACQITYMGVIRASNAGTGTILEYLGLILIVVWVCLTHRRWPRACEVIAIVLAVTGTFLLCTHGSLDNLVITPSALAWGAVAALTLATYTLLPVRLIAAYGADVVVGYALLIAGLGVGLVGRVWRYAITWTPDVALAMVITVVLGTTVAFTAYLWGVDRIGPVKASLIGSLEPIAATALSALVMGTSYTGVDLVGMALIVGAVVTISVVDLLRARRVTQEGGAAVGLKRGS